MALYVIGDLHLSFSSNKPMDVFGSAWDNHHEKIKKDWLKKVKEEDTVILPGDTSWGISLDEAKRDLDWINQLPGKKIIFKGNHDYWWTSKKKMDPLYPQMTFVHNTYALYEYQGEAIAICGTRGWLCPNRNKFTDEDERVYKREILRLEHSIASAQKDGYHRPLIAMHYPPMNDQMESSGFTDMFKKYHIQEVVYGHVHGTEHFKQAPQGDFDGITYHLTSCDFLDFKLFHWR